ncbi:MAG: hypothetical protein LIP12_06655 [Clostridiales bacterium]|nr:hypothetical protein [Clostridiales bacterium]
MQDQALPQDHLAPQDCFMSRLSQKIKDEGMAVAGLTGVKGRSKDVDGA